MDEEDILDGNNTMTKRQNSGKTDTVAALSLVLLSGLALAMLALFIISR